MIRTILFALALLCSPAAADPATIGALIIGTEIGSTVIAGNVTVGAVVGFVAINAVLLGASYGLQAALAQKAQDPSQSGQFVTRQPTPSRRRNYGRVQVAGPTIFADVATVGPVKILYRVIAINEGEIDAIESHKLDDNSVVLVGTAVVGAYMFSTASFVHIDTRLGLATETAYSDLITLFPTKWSSSHRGDGVASLMISCSQTPNFTDFPTVYPGGTAPNPRVVIRAVKVWDPRDGVQDKDDPSTWTWSTNPILILLDFHRHADGLGLAVFDARLFTSAALIEDWIPAANICDESVGGVTRYACSGGYSIAEDMPAEVIAQILATCDGQTYQRPDGAIGVRVGKTIAPTITLTDKNIKGYSDLRCNANVFNECNEITAKYTSPSHDYQVVDADPWRDEDDIAERGQVLTKAIALTFVNDHSQVRRLMKIAHARANPEISFTLVTDKAGMTLINERYVHLTVNEVGLSAPPLFDRDFEIVPDSFRIDPTGQGDRCTMAVISMDQPAYDWDEGTEAGTPPAIP